jgi:hypothetical protein
MKINNHERKIMSQNKISQKYIDDRNESKKHDGIEYNDELKVIKDKIDDILLIAYKNRSNIKGAINWGIFLV